MDNYVKYFFMCCLVICMSFEIVCIVHLLIYELGYLFFCVYWALYIFCILIPS
jgi:hypothetical protein